MAENSIYCISRLLRSLSTLNSNFIYQKLLTTTTRFYSTSNSGTYYSVLGLKPDATEDEIKKAYYALSKQYHPDLNVGDKIAEAKILEVNEAFEVLGNKLEKEKYDNKLFPKVWERNSFVYDQDFGEPEAPNYIFRRKVFKNGPDSITQFYKHAKGKAKRKQRHNVQKLMYNKSQSCMKMSKNFSKF